MLDVETIRMVQGLQEYIERHVCEKITLKDLADAVGYSPWHTARIFKEGTGKSPFDYVRALRLSGAAMQLRDSKSKVIDVALEFVFDSQEGFTRAFSKEFGISPYKYSKKTPPIPLFMPSKIFDVYRQFHKEDTSMGIESACKSVFVQVIERPARKVLLKRGVKAEHYFEYCEEVGCDVWGVLCSVKEALYEPIGMWLPKHLIKPGTSRYVQGVEVPLDYETACPEGFEIIELPPCKLMIFQGEPYNDDDFMQEVDAVWKHIDKFQLEIYGYLWDMEAAPRFQLAPMGYRGYIEARPVKAVNS